MDNTFNLLKAFIEAQGYEVESIQKFTQEVDIGSRTIREYPDGCDYKLKKKPKQSKPRTVEYSEEFEQAWKLYPKKSGNKKAAAYEQWKIRCGDALRDIGYPDDEIDCMTEGTKRYAAYHKALNTPEQYIHQGSTFYGRERLYMDSWDIPKELTRLRLPSSDMELEGFARDHGLTYPAPKGKNYFEYRRLLESEIGRMTE